MVALCVAVALAMALMPGCDAESVPDLRRPVLDSLIQTVLLAGTADLEADARALDLEVARVCAGGAYVEDSGAKSVWSEARGAWKRLEMFNFGPATAYPDRFGPNTEFRPPRISKMVEVLNALELVTATTLPNYGAAARGLPVLEWLLFTPVETGSEPELDAPKARCAYLVAAASDLVTLTAGNHAAWTAFAPQFTDPGKGEDPEFQDLHFALSEVVNRMGFAVENIRRDRLGEPAGTTKGGAPQPDSVESPFSGRGIDDLRDTLATLPLIVHGSVNGLGLEDLPRLAARPDIVQSFDDAMAAALAALNAIAEPLAAGVVNDPAAVLVALDALGDLQRVIQTDLIGVLGLSLAFNDADGD